MGGCKAAMHRLHRKHTQRNTVGGHNNESKSASAQSSRKIVNARSYNGTINDKHCRSSFDSAGQKRLKLALLTDSMIETHIWQPFKQPSPPGQFSGMAAFAAV
jgi:hypothetical protein